MCRISHLPELCRDLTAGRDRVSPRPHASAPRRPQPPGPSPRGRRAVSFVLLSLNPALSPVPTRWALIIGPAPEGLSVDSSTSLDSVIPDLGLRGAADPHARAGRGRG